MSINKCTIKYFERIVRAYNFTFEKEKKDTFFGLYSGYRIGDSCFIGKNNIEADTAYRFIHDFL